MPCPSCGEKDWKKDNLCVWDNGTAKCFACGYVLDSRIENGLKTEVIEPVKKDNDFRSVQVTGKHEELTNRKISIGTCKEYDYQVGELAGQKVQIANYRDTSGIVVGQKLRYENKSFPWINYDKSITLFGAHLCTDTSNSIIVTEGEIDAMSIYEATKAEENNNTALQAVSLPLGAASAPSSIRDNLEWLLKFDKVVLWFDQDDAGKEAVKKCRDLFPLGKLYIVDFPVRKDANEVLIKDGVAAVRVAVKSAREVIPEGIKFGHQIDFSKLQEPEPKGLPLPYPIVTESLRGIKKGRLYVVGAGTGIGKSTFLKEVVYHWLVKHPELRIANIFLEESQKQTLQSYVAVHNNIPAYLLAEDPTILSNNAITETVNALLKKETLAFLDHFGSIQNKKFLNMLDYLASIKKMDVIILDHISMVISGSESSREGERKDIDILMTKLRELVERTGVTVIAVSHLSRPKGEVGFEAGKPVTLNAFRGSGSIAQIADVVISLERNQQHMIEGDKMKVRILKNRVTGKLGEMDTLYYMEKTGRLITIKEALHDLPSSGLGDRI